MNNCFINRCICITYRGVSLFYRTVIIGNVLFDNVLCTIYVQFLGDVLFGRVGLRGTDAKSTPFRSRTHGDPATRIATNYS